MGQEGRDPAQGASGPGFAFWLFCFAMYSQVRHFPFQAFGLRREREGHLVRRNLLGMVDSHRPRGPRTGRDSPRGFSGSPGPGVLSLIDSGTRCDIGAIWILPVSSSWKGLPPFPPLSNFPNGPTLTTVGPYALLIHPSLPRLSSENPYSALPV